MGKETGILLNTETGDVDIQLKRDARGLITQGLHLGDVSEQNQELIITMQPGELKEQPMLGVGIDNMLLENETLLYKHKIREQLEMDGFRVNRIVIDKQHNIKIDAEYR